MDTVTGQQKAEKETVLSLALLAVSIPQAVLEGLASEQLHQAALSLVQNWRTAGLLPSESQDVTSHLKEFGDRCRRISSLF